MAEELPNISDTSTKTPIGDGGKNLGDKGQILSGNPNLTKNPPSLTGAPGGLPGSPGAPGAPIQNTPEEDLNIDSLDEIFLDYKKGVSDGKITNPKDLKQVYNYLQDRSWTEPRIERLMLQFDFKSIPKFLEFILSKKYKQDEKINPQIGSQPGVGVVANEINKKVRSDIMGKVVINDDGTLGIKEAKSASASVDRLIKSSFKLEQTVKELSEAKIKKAGIMAIRKRAADEFAEGLEEGAELGEDEALDMEGMDDLGLGDDMGGDPVMDKLEEILSAIKGIKGEVDEVEEDFDSFEGPDTMNASTAIARAKDSVRNALAAVKSAKEDEKKGFPFFAKKDKKDDKDKDGEKDEKKDKKDDKKDKDKKDKKDDKKEASIDEVVDQITSRLAELRGVTKEDIMKEANLYPFSTKTTEGLSADNTNATSAKAQAGEINKEISEKGFHSNNPREVTIESALSKSAGAYDPPASGSSLKNDSVDGDYDKQDMFGKVDTVVDNSKKISMAEVSKLRQSDIKNTFDKAKLSFELASQQQFKGLLTSPLKTAFVAEMVNAGIEKTAAEDIAHNAFIEGFEKNQQVVLAELNTFMNKDINEFVKVARYTQEFKAKEAGETLVDETVKVAESEEEITKTASLRPSPVGSEENQFKSYWENAAAKNRRW